MLAAAAVCPHPPLLVPEAMGAAGLMESGVGPQIMESGAELQIAELRAACGAAVAGLAAARPDLIAVVGGAQETAEYEASAAGGLRDFGIPFTTGSGAAVLPLSLTVGSWLVRRFLAPPPGGQRWRLRLLAVRQSGPAAECLRIGALLAASAPRVALLVMGDGSARKVTGVPGAADPAAETYDAAVAAAFADADPGCLAGLDPALDGELMVAGRAAWQVLAGAADGRRPRGQLLYAAAPLDVSYLVASWET